MQVPEHIQHADMWEHACNWMLKYLAYHPKNVRRELMTVWQEHVEGILASYPDAPDYILKDELTIALRTIFVMAPLIMYKDLTDHVPQIGPSRANDLTRSGWPRAVYALLNEPDSIVLPISAKRHVRAYIRSYLDKSLHNAPLDEFSWEDFD